MKSFIYILAFAGLLFMGTSCSGSDEEWELPAPEQKTDTTAVRYVTMTAEMPEEEPDTRVGFSSGEGLDLHLFWSYGEKIHLFIYQDNKVYDIGEHSISNISNDGHSCQINVPLPLELNMEKNYQLSGLTGIEGTMDENGVLECSGERRSISPNTFSVPMYFTVRAGLQDFTVSFQHIGAIEVLHLTNQTVREIYYEPLGYQSANNWWYEAFSSKPIQGIYEELPYTPEWVGATAIAGGKTRELYTWFVPNGNHMVNARLIANINGGYAVSANEKSSTVNFLRGKAYHIRAAWNGARLFFGDEDVEAYDVVYSMNPMNWFATHSFDSSKKQFFTSWAIDPDGDGYPVVSSGPMEYDSGDTHYRTPTIEEWRVMFPTHDEMLVFDEAKDTFNCIETIEIQKQTMRFLADYRNMGNGVSYALRLKSNRSNHCYAYRYAMYEFPAGKYLSVTSRFIEDKSIGLNTIANENFWDTPIAGDQHHVFPFHGYTKFEWCNVAFNEWSKTTSYLGQGGIYWTTSLCGDGKSNSVVQITNHTVKENRGWNNQNYYSWQKQYEWNRAVLRFIIDD